MGEVCPICNTHQPYVQAITVDGEPAQKADEILARRLKCGHVLGGSQYEAFKKSSHDIDLEAFNTVQAARQNAVDKKSALWQSLTAPKKEA
jgi:hypothetical protein